MSIFASGNVYMDIEYHGNKELLNQHKTAFLASSTIPPDMVLECYDWATADVSCTRSLT